MALIPASILIVYLVGVLMYLLTRCCDRKSRQQSNGCSKCTLIFFSILCAIAVGAGKKKRKKKQEEEEAKCRVMTIFVRVVVVFSSHYRCLWLM